MAGILTRFKDIMAANFNALLDKVEDPMKMIDQYFRNLESDLGKVKAETAAVMAEEKRAKRELDECMESMNKMQKYAERALLAGNEADARTFLTNKNDLARKLESLQKTYDIAKDNSQKMKAMHDKILQDLAQLNAKRSELRAKVAVAETQERLNKIGASVSGAAGNMSRFNEMEEKINRRLNEADAMAELNFSTQENSVEGLMSKYDSGEMPSLEVEDELSDLKRKLGLGAQPDLGVQPDLGTQTEENNQ